MLGVYLEVYSVFGYEPKQTEWGPRSRGPQTATVLAHRGDPLRISSLWFHIKWLNYDDTHNMWEPWSGVRLTDALHSYLKTVHLSRLIPKTVTAED